MKRLTISAYHIAVVKDNNGCLYALRLQAGTNRIVAAFIDTEVREIPRLTFKAVNRLKKALDAAPETWWDQQVDDYDPRSNTNRLNKKTLRFYCVSAATCLMHSSDFK